MSRSRAELNTNYSAYLVSTYYVPGPRYSMLQTLTFLPRNITGKMLLSYFISSKKTADQETKD